MPSAASAAQIQQLNAQVLEMQTQCEGLEKERDFYFAKLRSIELIVGDRINLDHIDPEERDTLAKIQEVLYQTEDGFEVSWRWNPRPRSRALRDGGCATELQSTRPTLGHRGARFSPSQRPH